MSRSNRPTLGQRIFAKIVAAREEENYRCTKERKLQLFTGVTGEVLEIGPGTGANFPFFDLSVRWTGVEPNEAMHAPLLEKAAQLGVHINLITGLSEELGGEDDRYDHVISTGVLCSVDDQSSVLREIKRVLKPGGRFLFVEHVIDPVSFTRGVFQRAAPYSPWRYLSGGCDPSRDTGSAIRDAGFSRVEMEAYNQEGGGWIRALTRSHVCGYAFK